MHKCVSEGKICTRNGTGVVGYRKVLSIVRSRIGVVERVNTLKSKALSSGELLNSATSLTGRPGMRCVSQEEKQVIRVRLGRLDSSNGHESLGTE